MIFSIKFEISIPEELKYVLVSDWDLLTHKKSLFALPAKISVANILSDYIKNAEKLTTGNHVSSMLSYSGVNFNLHLQLFDIYLIYLSIPEGKNNMSQVRLNMTKEVAQGIQGFFDAFVGTQLLYKFERVRIF